MEENTKDTTHQNIKYRNTENYGRNQQWEKRQGSYKYDEKGVENYIGTKNVITGSEEQLGSKWELCVTQGAVWFPVLRWTGNLSMV